MKYRTTSWLRCLPLDCVVQSDGPHHKRMVRADLAADEHVRPGSIIDGDKLEKLKPGLLGRIMTGLVPADAPKDEKLESGLRTIVHTSEDEATIGTTSGKSIEEMPGDAAEGTELVAAQGDEKKSTKKPPGGR